MILNLELTVIVLVDLDEFGNINKVKITDFGVCKINGPSACEERARLGTDLYMAPEVHSKGVCSVKADSKLYHIKYLQP